MAGGSGGPGRGSIAALAAVLLLAVVLYLVGHGIVRHNALQNCLDSGRRDCAERVDAP